MDRLSWREDIQKDSSYTDHVEDYKKEEEGLTNNNFVDIEEEGVAVFVVVVGLGIAI